MPSFSSVQIWIEARSPESNLNRRLRRCTQIGIENRRQSAPSAVEIWIEARSPESNLYRRLRGCTQMRIGKIGVNRRHLRLKKGIGFVTAPRFSASSCDNEPQ